MDGRVLVLEGLDEAGANVKDITIDHFSVAAPGRELLKNASLKISHGKRYGLVGSNGVGKSTLLKLLAWRKIPVPKNIDVLLVEQEVVGDDKTALAAVVAANEELLKVRQEVAYLHDSISDDGDDLYGNDVGEKLGELYEKLQILGSGTAEACASKIWLGWPSLLLLDEPTNHLDLRAVFWLEEYLCRWRKTLLVVSHDRDFLNTVCGEIIHLHDLKLYVYRGNFDDFQSGYGQRRKEMNKKFEIYEQLMKAAKRTGNPF
ncbi:ATP-dependent transporter, putative [Ricinus communis]|uniref:ATP-dependent transporter, putative n=1 Tax=Ricinus communis TaxID=3988 RepID=B9SQW9_RICCO|nr:ATP-dependent transporter, putative [Ricinus communis]